MARKEITDRDEFALVVRATSAGESSVTLSIQRSDGVAESHDLDVPAALAAAAAQLGGGATAAQVRAAVRAFAAACRAQARAAGGWTNGG